MNRYIYLLIFLVLGIPGNALCQGFSSFNGRNHAELEWITAETEHFYVSYAAHLAGIEIEAGSIAEASYSVLAQNLGVTFDDKIRIYLSDEDEIANGFAMNVGNGHTNIWVHVNDIAESWTGREKWLRKVISHELAHIFHYRMVRSKWRPFDRLLGNSLPRFWTEGLAQYQTEDWDSFRGEQWLRTAVLDDRLSYSDASSNWNGRLLYAIGNSQVRYFAEQYGDSTLAEMLSIRKKALLGLVHVHDFRHAFRKATGDSYSEFQDDWRRHLNIQYNSLAATMENTDSLGTEILKIPGQYVDDVRLDRSTGNFVAITLRSVARPITQVVEFDPASSLTRVISEGAIGTQVSSNAMGVVFSRRNRGQDGSIVNDLFASNGIEPGMNRLTSSRRASFPDVSSDESQMAFVITDSGTANIFVRDASTGTERQITAFTGDQQIARLRWSPDGLLIAFSSFDKAGNRQIQTVNVNDGSLVSLTSGRHDDRGPVWSPEGNLIAFTSLRDGVPNVFALNIRTGTLRRITNVVSGTTVHDWIRVTDETTKSTTEKLVVISAKSKSKDIVQLIDPNRQPHISNIPIREDLWDWTTHRPPAEVPTSVAIDDSVVLSRAPYNSFQNLTHTFSVVSPYYSDGKDWGLFGATAWMEPLGKHLLFATGGYSIPSFSASSFFSLSYVNRQFRPTLQASLYHIPTSARAYGNTVIEERTSGTALTAYWPINRPSTPYATATTFARFRFTSVEPLDIPNIPMFAGLPVPEAGSQVDVRVGIATRKQRPYRHNVVHPLDGSGLRIRGTIGFRNTDIETPFVMGDISAYSILPGPLSSRFLVYGRVQAKEGNSLAQNYMGLSRYDELRISSPGIFELTFSDVERVRGYRSFSIGNRLAFGSIEYRVPVAPSLQTKILGLLSFGKTTASFFADGAVVFTDSDFSNKDARLSSGVEFKNALTLGGSITLMHAIGVAWPLDNPAIDDYEIYYRIRTSLPF